MTDNIVLLASYPKTGSTWLRRTLVEIFAPEGRSAEIVPSFLKSYPEESPVFTLFGDQCRFIKTHFYPSHPKFSLFSGKMKAVLTIKRHPLDVLLSSLNYAQLRGHAPSFIGGNIKAVDEIIADGEMQHYIDQFIENDGFPWHDSQCGAFSKYMPLWRSVTKEIPYLELCYEDMVAAPELAAATIYRFFDLPADTNAISALMERVDQQTKQDGLFFWSRRAYNYESKLPKAMSSDFNARYQHVLEDLGYSQRG